MAGDDAVYGGKGLVFECDGEKIGATICFKLIKVLQIMHPVKVQFISSGFIRDM